MQKNKPTKLSVWKRIFHTCLESFAAILGGSLIFVCGYWFFHYDTWLERFIAIGLTVLVVYLIARILPDRPDQ